MLEAYNRGDREEALTYMDEDAVWDFSTVPDGNVYHGRDEIIGFWQMLDSIWEFVRVEPQDQEESGEHVITQVHVTTRGKGSGIELDQREAHVWRVRNGKLAHGKVFFDVAEARRWAKVPAP